MAGSCLGLGALVEKAGMIENSRLQTRVQVPLGSFEEFKGIRVQLLNFPLHISLQLFFFSYCPCIITVLSLYKGKSHFSPFLSNFYYGSLSQGIKIFIVPPKNTIWETGNHYSSLIDPEQKF